MSIVFAIFGWFVFTLLGIGTIVLLEPSWSRIGRPRRGASDVHGPSATGTGALVVATLE